MTFITEIPYFFRNNPFYIDGRTNPYELLTVYELKSLGEKMKKTILASMLAVMMATPAFAAESTDIVIIGSGGAGLSSAITATEKGAKVIRA